MGWGTAPRGVPHRLPPRPPLTPGPADHDLLERANRALGRTGARETGLSAPTVAAAFTRMIELELLREITGRKRDRLFAYDPSLALLAQGAEPLR